MSFSLYTCLPCCWVCSSVACSWLCSFTSCRSALLYPLWVLIHLFVFTQSAVLSCWAVLAPRRRCLRVRQSRPASAVHTVFCSVVPWFVKGLSSSLAVVVALHEPLAMALHGSPACFPTSCSPVHVLTHVFSSRTLLHVLRVVYLQSSQCPWIENLTLDQSWTRSWICYCCRWLHTCLICFLGRIFDSQITEMNLSSWFTSTLYQNYIPQSCSALFHHWQNAVTGGSYTTAISSFFVGYPYQCENLSLVSNFLSVRFPAYSFTVQANNCWFFPTTCEVYPRNPPA